jgi:PAS domain S-box-containing protein
LRQHRDHLEERVTERTAELRKTNEELRQLRNLLINVVDSMPSVLVGVDREGRVIQWNREAYKEAGIPAEEAKRCKMEDVFPRLSGEMEKVREAIRDRMPKRDAKVTWKSNGRTRYLNLTVFPLITNGVEGAVIRVDDVTKRVRIEELMIQSEKMLTVGGLHPAWHMRSTIPWQSSCRTFR